MENGNTENPESENGIGPLTGIIIIVLMILAGGWYFLSERITKLEEKEKLTSELNIQATSTATTTETITQE